MERLRGLAAEVLALPNLTAHQRLVWETSLHLDAVPVQERSDRVAACVRESGQVGFKLPSARKFICSFFWGTAGLRNRGHLTCLEGQGKRSALAATTSK